MKILDDADTHWYCSICNIAAGKLKAQVTVLEANYLELKSDLDIVSTNLQVQTDKLKQVEDNFTKDLTAKVNNLQNQIDELKKDTSEPVINNLSSPKLDVPKIRSIITDEIKEYKKDDEELKLQEKKKNNLIFFKVPEKEFETNDELLIDDFTKLKEICEPIEIQEKDISQLFRIGKKNTEKTRPIVVTFKDEELRMKVLKKSRDMELKTEDGEIIKVSVSTDKTPKQRETERKLREEIAQRKANGETNLVIRNEKIVPFRQSAQKTWAMLFH